VTLGIRRKLILIIACTLFFVLGVHTYLQLNLQQAAFDDELHKRTALLKENLNQKALSQAETLTRLASEDIASYNLFSLINKINQAVQDTEELEYIVILNKLNKVYVHTSQPEQQQNTYIPKKHDSTSIDHTKENLSYTVTTISQAANPPPHNEDMPDIEDFARHTFTEPDKKAILMEFKLPIKIEETQWGNIILAYSLSKLSKQISQSQLDNQRRQEELTVKTFYFASAILIIAYVFTSQLSKRLIAPIITLGSFAKDLSQGNFSRAHSISTTGNDELSRLTRNFSDMAIKLENSYQQLEDYNQTLEKDVSQRTHELNNKNLELTKALKDLEESQQQLIHSEKMAALGQLIAGIAHEINTPLGAIQASVGNSSQYLALFNQYLPEFLANSSPAEHLLLCTLLEKAQHGTILSTREERKAKRKLIHLLDEQCIDKTEELAEMLVDMEMTAHIPQLLPSLCSSTSYSIVELAYNLTGISRNNETIQTAIGRASKVVFALKNFTHHDHSGNMVNSNINDGIKTVLILYRSLLKQGCEVIEHYGKIPTIDCYPDELNQVWTNLIHNALHAMQNKGILTISTTFIDDQLLISFTDTGTGIPLEVQPKIYESFFTTKPAGEGSGLGLGICKRIIDKHNGDIDFSSKIGETTFIVTLPV